MIDPAPLIALRVALALLFASAARHKLVAFGEFRETLDAYRLLPRALVPAAAAVVIAAEVAVAAALTLEPGYGAPGAALLLSLYAAAIALNLARGRREIDCGCGGPAARQPLSGALVARNAVLVVAALVCGAEPAARALLWVDALTIGGAVAVLAFAYAATNRLIAHASGLAALRGTA